MFQKLYKNLEEINIHGHEQTSELRQTRDAVLKLTEQLALLAATTPIGTGAAGPIAIGDNSPEKASRTLSFQKAVLIISSVGMALLGIIAILTIRASQIDGPLMQKEALQSLSAAQSNAFFSRMNDRQQNITEKEAFLEIRIAKLDSLLLAEHQSINELKKLNRTAVRTFISIRKDIEQEDQPVSSAK
jgi:hypothetical protein